MSEETIILVVHNRRLFQQLLACDSKDRVVVLPGQVVTGIRARAVIFVDLPTPYMKDSQSWLTNYRDWVSGALMTRLTPDGVVVGNPLDELARSNP